MDDQNGGEARQPTPGDTEERYQPAATGSPEAAAKVHTGGHDHSTVCRKTHRRCCPECADGCDSFTLGKNKK